MLATLILWMSEGRKSRALSGATREPEQSRARPHHPPRPPPTETIEYRRCFAAVHEFGSWPEASFSCVAAIRPESGMKPTCRDRSTDAVDPTATSILANGQGQKYLKGDADFAPTCWASAVSGRAHNRRPCADGVRRVAIGGPGRFRGPSVRRMRREEWLVCRLRFGHIALL